MNKERIEYLDGLRTIAIAMVVCIHAVAYVTITQDQSQIISWIQAIGVPIFFLVDGFLFSIKNRQNQSFAYLDYLKKSAKRLCIPWLIFSLLYAASRTVFEVSGFLHTKLIIDRSLGQIALAIYAAKIAPQLYFLLSLFFVRCLSVCVRRLLALPVVWTSLLTLVYAVVFRLIESDIKLVLAEGLDPILHALWGLQFYLVGIVLAQLHQTIRENLLILTLVFAGLTCILSGFLDVVDQLAPFWQYSYLLAAYFLAMLLLPKENGVTRLGKDTMGIYLLHTPILLKLLSVVVTKLSMDGLMAFVTVSGLAFVLSWILTRFISGQTKLRFLFGNF